MKVTLIHCYSDHNRGDTGIIYSIHDLVRKCDSSIDIRAMSVFSGRDSRLKTDHHHTKKVIPAIYPSFFPEPGLKINKEKQLSGIAKTLVFLKYALINTIIYLTKSKRAARGLLSTTEYESFENFITSDKVISKGGSFLYSFKGVSGLLFFIRMIYPFYLAKRFGVDCYIYSQSVGPFENKFAQFLFGKIQPHIKAIYLRESKCLKYIDPLKGNIQVICDAAFALRASDMPREKTQRDKKRVAITARPHKFKTTKQDATYIAAFSKLIDHVTENDYEVFLVPQVTGPSEGEDDRKVLDVLYTDAKDKTNIHYSREELGPRELKSLYGEMDFLVGTRLHSVIFALGMGVPCLNIAYHGTKSEGIMGSLGLESYVLDIETLTSAELIGKFESLQGNTERITEKLKGRIAVLEKMLLSSMSCLLLE